jgi:hypothetical protein
MTEETGEPTAASYTVTYDIEPQISDRNRLTVAFRFILAIPQVILVGGPGPGIWLGLPWGGPLDGGGFRWLGFGGGGGVMGAVAGVSAFISWFAIVFTGRQPRGLWDLTIFFMRWRSNVVAYAALLRDEYPPFGDGSYPVTFSVSDFPETRDRWSVGLRLIYAIPHLVVLFFLGIAWLVSAVISWFAILFTGAYPEGLYQFGVGYMRWSIRVQAYLLLMRDEYPPFTLEAA